MALGVSALGTPPAPAFGARATWAHEGQQCLGLVGVGYKGMVLGGEWDSHNPCLTLNSSKRDKKESDKEGTEVLLWAGSSLGAHPLLPSQSSVWAGYSLPQTINI